jgi:serine/threonine protein kinase
MATQQDNREAVKALFAAALEENPADRSSFLKERCSDASVCAEVERLLAEHDEAESFLSTPVQGKASATPQASPKRLSEGDVLAGRFRLVRFIASGGMGEVYEAEDQELRERVAVKTILPEILVQPNALARFRREVHLARQVTHPNVCRIFDLFRHKPDGGSLQEEIVFISMELLHGRTLGAWLEEGGRMSTVEAEPLVRQMASALAAAHEAGIIHRDFKPGNVVLVGAPGRWRAVVTDFGLALRSTISEETASLPTGQGLLGTPAYMSPEQIEGRPATSASDIYALGLVVYEIVTGQRPFQGDTPMVAAMKRLSTPPTPPRDLVPEVSPLWEAVILRCLEREPAKRFAEAQEVLAAFSARPTVQNKPFPPDPQARALEAAAPQESAVGRSTEVVAMVRHTDSGGLRQYLDREAISALTSKDVREKPFELEFAMDAQGKLQPTEICLRLDSPDFHPPSQTKKLRVPPQGDSPLCTFLIRPNVAGNLIANLELLRGEEIVVSRRIQTRALVEGSPVGAGVNIVSIPFTILVQPGDGNFVGIFAPGPGPLDQLNHVVIPSASFGEPPAAPPRVPASHGDRTSTLPSAPPEFSVAEPRPAQMRKIFQATGVAMGLIIGVLAVWLFISGSEKRQAVVTAPAPMANAPEIKNPIAHHTPPKDSYLAIKGPLGAEVRIDGNLAGTLPGATSLFVKVTPDSPHRVEAKLADESWAAKVSVSVKPGERLEVNLSRSLPPDKPAVTFSARPQSIQAGQSTTLIWRSQNATQILINGTPYAGSEGSAAVTPEKTTTYTVEARGPGGTATTAVTVNVQPVSVATPPANQAPEASAIQSALDRLSSAYGTKLISEVKRAWPGMDKQQENGLEQVLSNKNIRAIAVKFDGCSSPTVTGDTAAVTCTERMSYTGGGQRKELPAHKVAISLKKGSNGWQVWNKGPRNE